MRCCLLISCLVLLSLSATAQSKATQPKAAQSRLAVISGMVVDFVTKKPLPEATVSLLSPRDSSLITFQITGGDGDFTIRNVAAGAYRLQVTYVGYQAVSRLIRANEAPLNVGTLSLRPRTTTLNEVVVKEDRAPVMIKNDTLEFNAGSVKTRPDAPAASSAT